MKLISEIIQVYTMSENRAKEQQIKQLEMAKADDHYKIYTETILKCERNSKDPKTPTKKDIEKKSYRQFAGFVRAWKLKVHQWFDQEGPESKDRWYFEVVRSEERSAGKQK